MYILKKGLTIIVNFIMKANKSLILLMQFLSTLFSTITQILMFYMFWVTIRMWTLAFNFDFVSASVGFFLGYGLILYSLLVRGVKSKRFSTFMMSMSTIIFLLLGFNKLYKMIIDLGSDANVVMNYLFVILICSLVIYFVNRLIDSVTMRLASALFKTDEEQFELTKVSTHYSNNGVESYKSYTYSLKGFNPYNMYLTNTELTQTSCGIAKKKN